MNRVANGILKGGGKTKSESGDIGLERERGRGRGKRREEGETKVVSCLYNSETGTNAWVIIVPMPIVFRSNLGRKEGGLIMLFGEKGG